MLSILCKNPSLVPSINPIYREWSATNLREEAITNMILVYDDLSTVPFEYLPCCWKFGKRMDEIKNIISSKKEIKTYSELLLFIRAMTFSSPSVPTSEQTEHCISVYEQLVANDLLLNEQKVNLALALLHCNTEDNAELHCRQLLWHDTISNNNVQIFLKYLANKTYENYLNIVNPLRGQYAIIHLLHHLYPTLTPHEKIGFLTSLCSFSCFKNRIKSLTSALFKESDTSNLLQSDPGVCITLALNSNYLPDMDMILNMLTECYNLKDKYDISIRLKLIYCLDRICTDQRQNEQQQTDNVINLSQYNRVRYVLKTCLQDKKRIVRQESARCLNRWALKL
ncbi:hypothetical protein GJ496_004183 [Pomphorhynchus laevis]|nr:hypothetical protein GJ496_004183 [Pomphorhynchus laevis]